MSLITNCTICNKSNAKLCNQCKSAAYCSSVCQKTDWSVHKLLCKEFSSKGDRPSNNHYLAILLPEQSDKPKLVWVEHYYMPSKYYKPLISELLSETRPIDSFDRHIIHWNELRNFALNDTVRIYFRDAFLNDGSGRNQSLQAITKGQHRHDWRGPMVVIRNRGITGDPEHCTDVTLADLRCAVDYFVAYGADARERGPQSQGHFVEGVKISCVGDKVIHGDRGFSGLRVPMDHPVFGIQAPIPISKFLDMPLLAHQLRPDAAWKDVHTCSDRFGGSGPYENVAATFLHMESDPKNDMCGLAPMRWQDDVGSVLVVRQDRKPLAPEHIDALCDYCQFTLQPLFEVDDALDGGRSKADLRRFLTKAKFREHFEVYRKKMMDSCEGEQEKEGWKNAPSPY